MSIHAPASQEVSQAASNVKDYAYEIKSEAKEQMKVERTLGIIKPDAVKSNQTDAIVAAIEKKGLKVVSKKKIKLSRESAEAFYAVHKDRPFFKSLVDFMTSGEVVVMVLEGNNAVSEYRKIMGATNPEKAEAGTLRKEFGTDLTHNAVHGSDSLDNAKIEILHFFK